MQWLWYSNTLSRFITGDDRQAFSLATTGPAAPVQLASARAYDDRIPPRHPCNLPIPASQYEELTTLSWHGFRFLEPAAYEKSLDGGPPAEGDLLRTLVFGPNYMHCLLHPPSGLVLRLRSGAMELISLSPTGMSTIGKTRPRGSAALTFAAHPNENLIVYGDNSGRFHAHRFDESGFGRASKIAARERTASRVEFIQSGSAIMVGGMGYLAAYSCTAGKFAPLHDVSIAVKDFVWDAERNLAIVNQGLHGLAIYQYDQNGLSKIASMIPPAPVRQVSLSTCGQYLAISIEGSGTVNVYSIEAS